MRFNVKTTRGLRKVRTCFLSAGSFSQKYWRRLTMFLAQPSNPQLWLFAPGDLREALVAEKYSIHTFRACSPLHLVNLEDTQLINDKVVIPASSMKGLENIWISKTCLLIIKLFVGPRPTHLYIKLFDYPAKSAHRSDCLTRSDRLWRVVDERFLWHLWPEVVSSTHLSPVLDS